VAYYHGITTYSAAFAYLRTVLLNEGVLIGKLKLTVFHRKYVESHLTRIEVTIY